MRKKFIILGGSLNSANRGVNALTRGTINMIYQQCKNIDIVLLSNSIENDVENCVTIGSNKINVKEIWFKNKKTLKILLVPKVQFINKIFLDKRERFILETIKSGDLILDLSGGDSFSDIYGYKRFIENVLLKKIALKYNKKLILLPQTIGPFQNRIVASVAKKIIKGSTKTYARDILSYEIVVEKLKVDKNKVKLIPDMAFWLNPSKNINIQFNKNEYTYVGINISGLLINGGYNNKNMFNFKTNYKELMKKIISLFENDKHVKLIFIPHVVPKNLPIEDDILAAKNLLLEMKLMDNERMILVSDKLKEDKLKGIIGKCDFFIGGRMHACIGAISSKVPTVPIAYSRKFLGIWKKFGLDRTVADPRNEEVKSIINKVTTTYNDRDAVKQEICKKLENIKNEYKDLQNEINMVGGKNEH